MPNSKLSYEVVWSPKTDGLANIVERRAADGWQLQGGVAATITRDPRDVPQVMYYQAMVKSEAT